MDIRFISSLTPDDENRFAPALLSAVGSLLDQLPIAYTLRIETAGAKIFQHSHSAIDQPAAEGNAAIEAVESIVSAWARDPKVRPTVA